MCTRRIRSLSSLLCFAVISVVIFPNEVPNVHAQELRYDYCEKTFGGSCSVQSAPTLPLQVNAPTPEPIPVFANPGRQTLYSGERVLLSVSRDWQAAALTWAARVLSGNLAYGGVLSLDTGPF